MGTSLLNGYALVIDDEINDANSSIAKMITTLEKEGTLFIKCGDLPAENTRNNLSGISFIVLDWDIKGEEQTLPEGVQLGTVLENARTDENITFINDVLKKYFVPIFIFSQENKDSITATLQADTEIVQVLEKRIFVKNKSDLADDNVKTYLSEWLTKNKTVLALKMYEEQLNKSKNAFLVEVGDLDPNWTTIVYNTLKLDHVDKHGNTISQHLLNLDFRDFLTAALLGRMNHVKFEEAEFNSTNPAISDDEICKIYESIKFYEYGEEIDNGQAYEGDIYQKYEGTQLENEYLLNINAPCDIRKKKILLLQGVTVDNIDKKIVSSYFLPSFAQKTAIQFKYDERYRVDKLDDLSRITIEGRNYRRIGRIIHPYITAIRSEFAHFISRQGIPRHP